MQIKVCSSTVSGKCDEFRGQVQCGSCYVGEAGICLSPNSIEQKAKIDNDLLADAKVVNTLHPGTCSANRTLEDWVYSKQGESW